MKDIKYLTLEEIQYEEKEMLRELIQFLKKEKNRTKNSIFQLFCFFNYSIVITLFLVEVLPLGSLAVYVIMYLPATP